MTVADLIPVLQMAVGPVVLISGVGLLIATLNNRLGRVVDRGRSLASEHRRSPQSEKSGALEQLHIIARRAHLLRRSIFLSVLCVLFAAVLIITLFFTAALHLEVAWLIGLLFVFSLGSLILSLIYFLEELNQALIAFHVDIGM
jgi:hypothetical protein